MAQIYYVLIKKGLRDINNIPSEFKEKVQAMLNNDMATSS